jgi:hypothetical protein
MRAGSANVLVVSGFIAVWGPAAAVLIAAANLLPARLGLTPALARPIIANEVFLGIWLIAKGFGAKAERVG